MSFEALGLNPEILRAVAEQGYREPTPIPRALPCRCYSVLLPASPMPKGVARFER